MSADELITTQKNIDAQIYYTKLTLQLLFYLLIFGLRLNHCKSCEVRDCLIMSCALMLSVSRYSIIDI